MHGGGGRTFRGIPRIAQNAARYANGHDRPYELTGAMRRGWPHSKDVSIPDVMARIPPNHPFIPTPSGYPKQDPFARAQRREPSF